MILVPTLQHSLYAYAFGKEIVHSSTALVWHIYITALFLCDLRNERFVWKGNSPNYSPSGTLYCCTQYCHAEGPEHDFGNVVELNIQQGCSRSRTLKKHPRYTSYYSSTFPGFIIPWGSNRCFIFFIMSTATADFE
jgi:hypothetical protein